MSPCLAAVSAKNAACPCAKWGTSRVIIRRYAWLGHWRAVLYTPATKRALSYALSCHEGQVDRSELPYVLHPIHLAEQMRYEDETCVALLHDVMEDCGRTEDDLRAIGMSERVVETLSLLTHDPAIPYEDYVRALAHNRVARSVKLADLRHNSQLSRLSRVSREDLARLRKYMEARVLLGDMSYGLETPVGSVRVLVNGEPYPFELVDETREGFAWYDGRAYGDLAVGRPDRTYLLRIETLSLSVGDIVTVSHNIVGEAVDYGSDERVNYGTYQSQGWTVCLGTYDDEETSKDPFGHSFRLIGSDSGEYVIVDDPVAHRFRDWEHLIPVRVAWVRGDDEATASIASWVGGYGF